MKELTCRHTAQNTDIPVQWPGFKWSDKVWKLGWDVNEWFLLFVISTVSARTVWGDMWLSEVSQSSQMTVRHTELPQTTCCYSRFASPAMYHADILHLLVVVLWLSLVVLYLFMANLHLFISLWSFCISQPEKEVKVHTIWLVVLGSNPHVHLFTVFRSSMYIYYFSQSYVLVKSIIHFLFEEGTHQ